MRLNTLNPEFLGSGGEGVKMMDGTPVPHREGVGVQFDCPCGCTYPGGSRQRIFIAFDRPLDGGPPVPGIGKTWIREGDTFETLKLSPSILRMEGCRWHGFIGLTIPGEVTTR